MKILQDADESCGFSIYQSDPIVNDNDKFDKTTILIYPGIHKLDKRAGFSIHDNNPTTE